MVAGVKLVAVTLKIPDPASAAATQVAFVTFGSIFVDTQTPRAVTVELPCEVTVPPKRADVLVKPVGIAVVTVGACTIPSWVTVIILGELTAPGAVIVIVALRLVIVVFAVKVAVSVALPVPEGALSVSHVSLDTADHAIVPVPVLEMEIASVPAVADFVMLAGVTVKTGAGATFTVNPLVRVAVPPPGPGFETVTLRAPVVAVDEI
jgi:hypothetical protein